jgi:hypothetical protein
MSKWKTNNTTITEIKMENVRNVKESIRKYDINTVISHNFL